MEEDPYGRYLFLATSSVWYLYPVVGRTDPNHTVINWSEWICTEGQGMARVLPSGGFACALWISETVDREHVTGRPAADEMRSPRCMCLAAPGEKTLTINARYTLDPADRSHCVEPSLQEATSPTNLSRASHSGRLPRLFPEPRKMASWLGAFAVRTEEQRWMSDGQNPQDDQVTGNKA